MGINARLIAFHRLIVRPLFREPARTLLTVLAVALGVAVVLAIDLAGTAAAGSFHSSLESLTGDADLEVTSTAGVPGQVVATLATVPFPMRVQPRIADFATIVATGETVPLFGVDTVAESMDANSTGISPSESISASASQDSPAEAFANLDGVWLSSDLGYKQGDTIQLQIDDHARQYPVLGTFDASQNGSRLVVMDLALADRELGRNGRVDRVLLTFPPDSSLSVWQQKLRALLPAGVEIQPVGSQTEENRRMLAAFRWNLRVLSYIALVVGAFLIYNTISVSVVRRRAEIGIVRALGATRLMVIAAFLGEAACFGLAGALAGCLLGRAMATWALKLLAATVDSLYVSSRPAPIHLDFMSLAVALLIGIGVAVIAAWAPAQEAATVSPAEAMARGRAEYAPRLHHRRNLLTAVALAACAFACCLAPAIAGKPLFGYLAALLLIAASALTMPPLTAMLSEIGSRVLRGSLGVEGVLASRSLGGSLRRTSVLVGALATAIAMITSVGIMVGSFRQTVEIWMDNQLQADFYLRAAGSDSAGQHPTIAADIAGKIAHVPGVAAVDRFRAYDISYEGLPATLGSLDLQASLPFRKEVFLSGRPASKVYPDLLTSDSAVISEPFANKHRLRAGDSISLPLAGQRPSFRIVDVFYDYASEGGYIMIDRSRLLKYLPDQAPSNLAVYLSTGLSTALSTGLTPRADPDTVRAAIEHITANRRILIFSNKSLRAQGIQIFDRTFAITYALEAVSIMVAIIGIAGALLALVVDRRREFGLMRFLGASSSQIRKLIVIEAGLIGLFANIAGFALGFALSLILIYVINKQSFGWTIQFHWPVAVLVSALTLVYLVTLLAGLYPARVAVRLNPIEVVHEE